MANEKPYAVSPGWRIIARDVGFNLDNVLRRAELPEDLFARDQAALSTQEYFRLWSAIEQESDDPILPLKIGAVISVEAFSPPIFAALCSPNLNVALARLAHYKRLIASMALRVDVDESRTKLELEWLDKTVEPPTSLVLVELVFFVQLSRIATRERIRPLEIISPVLPRQRRDYTEYFGVPIKRGNIPSLRFAPADASRPFLTANEKIWQFFEQDLKKRLSDLTESATTEDRVHAALLELLPSGASSIETVAKKLGISARTLQRRLKSEGCSFQAVLDQTREALAKHYLRTTAMTGAEISFLLGFEDPNSFFRAFNSWTGTTPERARRELVGVH
ncbi:MAG: AraC family transcriptional regulator [Proteobacteria bacterium]|nr:AraC family transcriptional regulator [Pseudomonadota bacterium]